MTSEHTVIYQAHNIIRANTHRKQLSSNRQQGQSMMMSLWVSRYTDTVYYLFNAEILFTKDA